MRSLSIPSVSYAYAHHKRKNSQGPSKHADHARKELMRALSVRITWAPLSLCKKYLLNLLLFKGLLLVLNCDDDLPAVLALQEGLVKSALPVRHPVRPEELYRILMQCCGSGSGTLDRIRLQNNRSGSCSESGTENRSGLGHKNL
jgi:hypothetical protein